MREMLQNLREKFFPLPDKFDALFADYIRINQRFPQASRGIALAFADFALSQKEFNMVDLVDRKLDRKEIEKLGDKMDETHASFAIPVATSRGYEKVQTAFMEKHNITDQKKVRMQLVDGAQLDRLWLGFKARGLQMIASAAGVTPFNDEWPELDVHNPDRSDQGRASFVVHRVQNLTAVLENPEIFEWTRSMIGSFKETLASEEGKVLGREIRLKASEIPKPRDGATPRILPSPRTQLIQKYDELMALCISNFKKSWEKEHGEFSDSQKQRLETRRRIDK